MNTKKIIGVVAVLALVAVALVGAGAATDTVTYYVGGADASDDNNGLTSATPVATLHKAVALVLDGNNASKDVVIEVQGDVQSVGFSLPYGKYNSLTINLNGYTVTFAKKAAGSTGTISQAIQILAKAVDENPGEYLVDNNVIINGYNATTKTDGKLCIDGSETPITLTAADKNIIKCYFTAGAKIEIKYDTPTDGLVQEDECLYSIGMNNAKVTSSDLFATMINNYGTLTLADVILDGTYVDRCANAAVYTANDAIPEQNTDVVLINNAGSTTLYGVTIIEPVSTKLATTYAFKVSDESNNKTSGYYNKNESRVVIGNTCDINGNVYVGNWHTNSYDEFRVLEVSDGAVYTVKLGDSLEYGPDYEVDLNETGKIVNPNVVVAEVTTAEGLGIALGDETVDIVTVKAGDPLEITGDETPAVANVSYGKKLYIAKDATLVINPEKSSSGVWNIEGTVVNLSSHTIELGEYVTLTFGLLGSIENAGAIEVSTYQQLKTLIDNGTTGTIRIVGDVELETDLVIPTGVTIEIDSTGSLDLAGFTITNAGTIINYGKVTAGTDSVINNYGLFTNNSVNYTYSNITFNNYGTLNGTEKTSVKNLINYEDVTVTLDSNTGGQLLVNGVAVPSVTVKAGSPFGYNQYTGEIAIGNDVVIRAVPNTGYELYTVVVNTTPATEVSAISGNTVIRATFIADSDVYDTFFNYQKVTALELPAGTYMTADKAHKLVVTYDISDVFYIPESTVEGQYFLNGDDKNTPIYVQKAGVTDSDLLKGTKVYSKSKFYANASFAAAVNAHIVLKKDDAGNYLTQFPGMTAEQIAAAEDPNYPLDQYTTEDNGYQLTSSDVGTWAIYAEIDASEMKKDTPEEYRYVKLGELKVVSNKDHGSTTAVLSTDSVKNGTTFSIAVEAPKTDIITVGYRSDDDEDSFNQITTDSANKVFYLLKGQENFYASYPTTGATYKNCFVVPETENLSISINAQTGLITDKKYTLVVKNNSYTDENNKAIEVELEITVKGNVFTAVLEKDSYDIGENVKINGTYENSLPLYFYVEGSNITFMNIQHQEDYVVKATPSVTSDVYYYYEMKEKSNGTDWTFTIQKELINGGASATGYPADTRDIWNPGTYTIYVSTVAPSYTNIGTDANPVLDYKNHVYTTAQKAAISAGGKVLTLTLTQPVITITYAQDEVEKNKFEKITIDAQGTDKLQVYVVGQNQTKFISVKEENKAISLADDSTVADHQIFSMKSGDNNYLYNTFSLEGTGLDNTISNVLKVYGPKDYVKTENYDASKVGKISSHLAVKNTDGTYSFYVYIPATNWDYGQYYVVAQHPMADGKFNVTGVAAGTLGSSYKSGYDIIGNPTYDDNGAVTGGTFLFNIPAVAQLEAAQKLVTAIENYNDKQHGGDFWVVAEADELNNISGVQTSYKQGEVITILVNNADKIDGATLEANTFDFTADNLNYIQSFAVKQTKTGDNVDLTMTLDTSEVPAGDYVIVIKEGNDVVKTYETKIIGDFQPVVEVSVSIAGASSLTVGDTTVLTAKNSDGSTAKFAWKSSDASVASVDENGNVIAKKAGTVTITVENTVTGKTATKTIVVADKSTPVTPTPTKTPGFGILAALAGLGAVAALVLRRK